MKFLVLILCTILLNADIGPDLWQLFFNVMGPVFETHLCNYKCNAVANLECSVVNLDLGFRFGF